MSWPYLHILHLAWQEYSHLDGRGGSPDKIQGQINKLFVCKWCKRHHWPLICITCFISVLCVIYLSGILTLQSIVMASDIALYQTGSYQMGGRGWNSMPSDRMSDVHAGRILHCIAWVLFSVGTWPELFYLQRLANVYASDCLNAAGKLRQMWLAIAGTKFTKHGSST